MRKSEAFFARPSAHLWPVDNLCLISASWCREQKQSCTKHVWRFRPPPVSGGCARSSSWRHLETMRCPYSVPVNAAGSACMPSSEFRARGRGRIVSQACVRVAKGSRSGTDRQSTQQDARIEARPMHRRSASGPTRMSARHDAKVMVPPAPMAPVRR